MCSQELLEFVCATAAGRESNRRVRPWPSLRVAANVSVSVVHPSPRARRELSAPRGQKADNKSHDYRGRSIVRQLLGGVVPFRCADSRRSARGYGRTRQDSRRQLRLPNARRRSGTARESRRALGVRIAVQPLTSDTRASRNMSSKFRSLTPLASPSSIAALSATSFAASSRSRSTSSATYVAASG